MQSTGFAENHLSSYLKIFFCSFVFSNQCDACGKFRLIYRFSFTEMLLPTLLRCVQIILDKYLFVDVNSHIYLPQIDKIFRKHVFSNNCLNLSHFRFQKRK